MTTECQERAECLIVPRSQKETAIEAKCIIYEERSISQETSISLDVPLLGCDPLLLLLLVRVARIKLLDIPPRGPRERTIETFSTTTRVAHTRGVLVTESPVASCMLGNLSRARLQKAAAI